MLAGLLYAMCELQSTVIVVMKMFDQSDKTCYHQGEYDDWTRHGQKGHSAKQKHNQEAEPNAPSTCPNVFEKFNHVCLRLCRQSSPILTI